MFRCTRFLLSVLLATLVSNFAAADDEPLRWSIDGGLSTRTAGPMSVRVQLDWSGATLLEGRLALQIRDGFNVLAQAASALKVLQTGRTEIEFLLPPIDARPQNSPLLVQAEFLTKDGQKIASDTREVSFDTSASRRFRILRCDGSLQIADEVTARLQRTLRFERFWCPLKERDPNELEPSIPVQTKVVNVTPSQMPEDAHWLCGADVLLVTESGFSLLRKRQLEAISQWVRAGGSLIVEPLGRLASRHFEFLQQLRGGDVGTGLPVWFEPTIDGTLDLSGERSVQKLQCGLGRVVMLCRSLSRGFDFEAFEWTDAVAFAWSFRRDQLGHLDELNRVSDQVAWSEFRFTRQPPRSLVPAEASIRKDADTRIRPYGNQWGSLLDLGASDLAVKPIRSGQGLLRRLMPDDVTVIPLGYIVLILLCYMTAIGPGDYLLLGALRLRRYTWVTFPLTTIAFTGFTVWLSHSFLDTSTERSSVTVFDLSPAWIGDSPSDGQPPEVVRANRFELLFTGASSEVTTELHSSLFTPLDHGRFGGVDGNKLQQSELRRVPAPTISGLPPGNFAAVQELPQWTPQINRILTIVPKLESVPASLSEFDWNRNWDFQSDSGRRELSDAIQDSFGEHARGRLFHGRDRVDLSFHGPILFGATHLQLIEPSRNSSSEHNHVGDLRTDLLSELCVRLQGLGLFGVVSQIAPHGGDNFEDLSLLDPSDSAQWLLVVAEPKPDDLRLYRRLYRLPQTVDVPAIQIENLSGSNAL